MKKTIILASVAILFCLFAFKIPGTLNSAKAKQHEGVYLFHFSEPAGDYKYLGTVKVAGVTWDNNSETYLKSLMKRLKKDYPTANGLIISDDYEKADAVMLSE
jgi:hypothetical protein